MLRDASIGAAMQNDFEGVGTGSRVALPPIGRGRGRGNESTSRPEVEDQGGNHDEDDSRDAARETAERNRDRAGGDDRGMFAQTTGVAVGREDSGSGAVDDGYGRVERDSRRSGGSGHQADDEDEDDDDDEDEREGVSKPLDLDAFGPGVAGRR